MDLNKIYNGNCLEVLKTFEDNSLDGCVTDPPYGISFMNKHWDYELPEVEVWKEVLRVLKPGGHLLCACGTRTQHRMAVNIEDAGFEIRDVITWLYGSGFPKSLDISKAIDKQKGTYVEGEESKNSRSGVEGDEFGYDHSKKITLPNPQSDEAKEWLGWGTALKPAVEFWTLARKPISENTVADNVLKHGTGGINIDGSRIGNDVLVSKDDPNKFKNFKEQDGRTPTEHNFEPKITNGRFPANLILDEFSGKTLDEQSDYTTSTIGKRNPNGKIHGVNTEVFGEFNAEPDRVTGYLDSGGASRFFYCPKADDFERNKGLKNFDEKLQANATFRPNHLEKALEGDSGKPHGRYSPKKNNHPTVKPIDLMRYLVKLIIPKGGSCIDPYCGSGTTLIGCKLELINYLGIEREAEYCKIAEARVAAWNPEKYLPQTLF